MRPIRLLLLLAFPALLAAIWGGWHRLGWRLPTPPALTTAHGPLMVLGFLGALIPLERAAALRRPWMLAAPLMAGAGWVALLIAPRPGMFLLTLSSWVTVLILGVMLKQEPRPHTLTMALGALALAVGNALWLAGQPIFKVVYAWMAFLVLTIAGERLELSRVLRPSPAQISAFLAAVVLLTLATGLIWINLDRGARLFGLGAVVFGLWGLRYDLAARNLRHPQPLTRYMAVSLFSGFIWLSVAGLLLLILGAQVAGPLYDAPLHALFVGFVITMIFAHAPIILPTLLGRSPGFTPFSYLNLGLLHVSLLLRLVGDLTLQPTLRGWGGLFNGVAILLFLFFTLVALMRKRGA